MTLGDDNYVFPNVLANAMAKVDFRTQLEASMLSMTFMMVGLIVTSFYIAIYIDFQTWYKFFLVLNAFAGVIFMSSFLITTFQQYKNYMSTIKFQTEMKGG
jgi:hypothetical protein|tara:strand:- start:1080 stop:1382 length:303 start_codon:yes stop_codon:yes gene_type:complete